MEVTNHCVIGLGPYYRMEAIPDTAKVTKNLRLDRPQEEIILLNECSNKMTPNKILLHQCITQPSSERCLLVADSN